MQIGLLRSSGLVFRVPPGLSSFCLGVFRSASSTAELSSARHSAIFVTRSSRNGSLRESRELAASSSLPPSASDFPRACSARAKRSIEALAGVSFELCKELSLDLRFHWCSSGFEYRGTGNAGLADVDWTER